MPTEKYDNSNLTFQYTWSAVYHTALKAYIGPEKYDKDTKDETILNRRWICALRVLHILCLRPNTK